MRLGRNEYLDRSMIFGRRWDLSAFLDRSDEEIWRLK
jgi:hypothetical protein